MKAISLIVIILAIMNAGLVCQYDPQQLIETDFHIPLVPDKYQFLEDKIYFQCSDTITDYSCLTTITYANDSETILQVNPVPEDVKGVGRIDQFLSEGQAVNVYFRAEQNIIRQGINYSFNVYCGNGSVNANFNATITPEYRELDAPITYLATQIGNIGFFLALFFLIFIILLVAGGVWKISKI